ncbi:BglG family transcription antiterminator [Desmospora profundinema]|uniref:Transcriptional antiterminator/mannitol/fructose-specific phosphotransferase system IIA component (Ntr-type) n=1 Tax=Desmospora profundinema TaxID=1571184 RepID=A0ABU1IK78_9BACL|nr:PRD domain-containing protein [Desmospora profundinema]MDR6225163.1 transcriptional antiterminator/mannitol/fructose-specific phosphotransferase system IIA component (Ntr-type) [Desmospora profundinema]
MNTRQIHLIHHLLNEERPLSVQQLAERLGCSERTVRNDLREVKGWVEKQAFVTLERKPGVGVFLSGGERDRDCLRRALPPVPIIRTNERGERLYPLLSALLEASGPLTTRKLAERLFVSPAVLYADLDQAEEWLRKRKLRLVRKPNWGNRIIGNEKAWRLALSEVQEKLRMLRADEKAGWEQSLPVIRDAVHRLEKRLPFSFTEEGFTNLVMHLAIAIRRIKTGNRIVMEPREWSQLREKEEYRQAEWLANQLETPLAVRIPPEEIGYLTMHVLGAKIQQKRGTDGEVEQSVERVDPEAVRLSHILIQRMSGWMGFPFESDQALLDGVSLHLHSALNRLRHGLRLTNPLLPEIKGQTGYLFDGLLHHLPHLQEGWNVAFHEDEVGYLALHFQASLERSAAAETEPIRIIIVCSTGTGTSELLRARIRRLFPDLVVAATVARSDVPEAIRRYRPDGILSMIPLEAEKVPVIPVTPLLSRNEEENIRRILFREVDRDPYPVLSRLLQPEHMMVGITGEDRESVIQQLVHLLSASGAVEPDFSGSALRREKLASTAIGQGVAIPHGAPEWVNRDSLALAVLPHPVDWEGEPVWLVLLLASSGDRSEDIRALFREVSELVEDSLRLLKLREVQISSEVISILTGR